MVRKSLKLKDIFLVSIPIYCPVPNYRGGEKGAKLYFWTTFTNQSFTLLGSTFYKSLTLKKSTSFKDLDSFFNPFLLSDLPALELIRILTWNGLTRLLAKSSRSSRSQMFFKLGVLRNFANFIGKYLHWSLRWPLLKL